MWSRKERRVPSPGCPCTPVPGDLLVASVASTDRTSDETFDHAVVLVLEVDDDGTIGVILNRPVVDSSLDGPLPGWADVVSAPDTFFYGGPVSDSGALCLARLRDDDDRPLGFGHLFGEIGVVELDTPLPLVDSVYADARVFVGYAGWDNGQLADELRDGLWHVVPALPEDAFSPEPDHIWRSVLRRCPSQTAFFATWAPVPILN